MGAVDDLNYLGAPTEDPARTAMFIGGMILTRSQKADLFKRYLMQKGLGLSPELRVAADLYADKL